MRFGRILATGVVVGLTTSAALAQSVETDWAGFYAGLGYGTSDGSNFYEPGGGDDPEYTLSGDTGSLFAGYNWVRGPMVYGAELSFSSADVSETALDGEAFPEYQFTEFVDLKARIGYATGKVLVYGTLGYSSGDFIAGDLGHFQSTGYLYGVGVDYSVGSRYFVGAEIIRRELTNDYPIDTSANTFSIRGGITF